MWNKWYTPTELFEIGWKHQMKGDIDLARKYYVSAANKGFDGSKLHLLCLDVFTRKLQDAEFKNNILLSQQEFDVMYKCYMMKTEDVITQASLSLLYYIRRDNVKAIEWREKAARNGCIFAKCGLGILYEEESRFKEAHEWFLIAASYGSVYACDRLGVLYKNGLGVDRDYSKAVEWFERAIKGGYPRAELHLKTLYEAAYNWWGLDFVLV